VRRLSGVLVFDVNKISIGEGKKAGEKDKDSGIESQETTLSILI